MNMKLLSVVTPPSIYQISPSTISTAKQKRDLTNFTHLDGLDNNTSTKILIAQLKNLNLNQPVQMEAPFNYVLSPF